MYYQRILNKCQTLAQAPKEHALYVKISEQKLYVYFRGVLEKVYPVSTSRRPPSCVENSLGTPLGLHCIAEKIGDGAPLGMVFKGRVPQGTPYMQLPPEESQANLITTRILWLRGLEPENSGPGCDTYSRYVYIHGTNQEDQIGTPNSHGCVLLRNQDVIELFDRVPTGTLVLIEP